MPYITEKLWIPLVLFFGLCKGTREILKKKALEKSSGLEILLVYTVTSFILVFPSAPEAFKITQPLLYLAIAIKSLFVFIGWMCGFAALSKMPVSVYGILDLSGVIFSTLFAVCILGETLTMPVIIGIVLVCLGLYFLKFQPKSKRIVQEKAEKIAVKYIILAFCYTMFNSASGTMDKLLRKEEAVSVNQLQFWFMFFLSLYYILYFLIRRIPVNLKNTLKNYKIYIMSISLVLGDKALFTANAGESTVSVMTLLKQIGCICVIIGGRIFFGEKNTLYKLFCAAIIIAGIVVATL